MLFRRAGDKSLTGASRSMKRNGEMCSMILSYKSWIVFLSPSRLVVQVVSPEGERLKKCRHSIPACISGHSDHTLITKATLMRCACNVLESSKEVDKGA